MKKYLISAGRGIFFISKFPRASVPLESLRGSFASGHSPQWQSSRLAGWSDLSQLSQSVPQKKSWDTWDSGTSAETLANGRYYTVDLDWVGDP